MARAAREASSSAGRTISSEYANPVFSPASARTPTPCSIAAVPSFTMPSSSAHDSSCASWKYRSAASTEWVSTCPITRSSRVSSRPLGRRMSSRAIFRGSGLPTLWSISTPYGRWPGSQPARSRRDRRFAPQALAGPRGLGPPRLHHAVPQRGECRARLGLPVEIEVAHHDPAPSRTPTQHTAPVVDDQRVAVGLAAVRMEARLGGSDDVAEVFDRPASEQGLPMRPAGRRSEGGRHAEDLRSAGAQGAVQLREAHIVTDGQSQAARGRFGDDRRFSWRDVCRLTVALLPAGNVDIEQMDLVVARGDTPPIIEQQARRGHPLLARQAQRHGARDDPEPEPPSCLRKRRLDGAVARGFG